MIPAMLSRPPLPPWSAAPQTLATGRPLDWTLDPLEALARWPADRRCVMLHSGRPHERWARWSLLAEPIGYYRFLASPGQTGVGQWTPLGAGEALRPFVLTGDPWRDLRTLLSRENLLWVGYLSYDLGRWVEDLPQVATDDRGWPVIELAACGVQLWHETASGRWYEQAPPRGCQENDRAWWRALPELSEAPEARSRFKAGPPVSVFEPRGYQRAVERVIDYIGAGDAFQVNLAQRFTAPFTGDFPLAHRHLFDRLARRSPAWYGAYLELGPADRPWAIASTSPELFLEHDVASGGVVSRPIKGTRPAEASAEDLWRSEKDAAELNMIVDLLRNDLGRVCAYGSMSVPQPRTVESHPTVHHGVATIQGRLQERLDAVDLLRATMPGGSITGAPKVRAMQIIDELEPVRRGPYCGAIGLLGPQGLTLNVAIRTLLLDPSRALADFSVGGGIVADSNPLGEYQETLDKAVAMEAALRG
jgi:para-aminobenzoate synthetase component 1